MFIPYPSCFNQPEVTSCLSASAGYVPVCCTDFDVILSLFITLLNLMLIFVYAGILFELVRLFCVFLILRKRNEKDNSTSSLLDRKSTFNEEL